MLLCVLKVESIVKVIPMYETEIQVCFNFLRQFLFLCFQKLQNIYYFAFMFKVTEEVSAYLLRRFPIDLIPIV